MYFKDIFTQIDENGDGTLTEEEFLTGCLEDDKLFKMLVPNVFQYIPKVFLGT